MNTPKDLIRVKMVPVEVGCTEESYCLCDAVSAWSDCNNATGKIFRLDDDFQQDHRNKEDTVEMWCTEENIIKLKTHFKTWINQQ